MIRRVRAARFFAAKYLARSVRCFCKIFAPFFGGGNISRRVWFFQNIFCGAVFSSRENFVSRRIVAVRP
jgi:hypothetical protein